MWILFNTPLVYRIPSVGMGVSRHPKVQPKALIRLWKTLVSK